MPYCTLLMLLFWTVLLLLPVPRLVMPIPLAPPKPTPKRVVVLLKPARLRFLMVLLVALFSPEVVCTQMMALAVPLLALTIVRSRVALGDFGLWIGTLINPKSNSGNPMLDGPEAEPS